MGADLFIESISNKTQNQYGELFAKALHNRDAISKEITGTAQANAQCREDSRWKEAQARVEEYHDAMYSKGYFRDSYNCWNMLWTLGLSWWQDVGKLLDTDGILSGNNLIKFREMVVNAEQVLPGKDYFEKYNLTITETGENSLPEIHKFFITRRQALLDFLDEAISLGEPIICSV
jgi:hypothetical protein